MEDIMVSHQRREIPKLQTNFPPMADRRNFFDYNSEYPSMPDVKISNFYPHSFMMKTAPTPRPWIRLLLLAMAASGLVSCEVYPAGYYSGYASPYPAPVYRPVPVVAPVPIPVPVPVRPWGGGYYGGGYGYHSGGYGYGGYRGARYGGYGYGHHGHCY
jgi:hypothetical protein